MSQFNSDRPKLAAGYTRVSTDKQVEEGHSLGVQRSQIEEKAAAEGWKLVEVFEDKGISGAREDRPKLESLLDRLAEFDVLIVPSLSRLGRSNKHLQEIFYRLREAEVGFISIKESFDSATKEGRFMRDMLSALAEMERETTSERVRDVSQAMIREGRHRSHPPTGYRSVGPKGDKRLVPGPEDEIALINTVFERFVATNSMTGVAESLDDENVPTLGKAKYWKQATISKMLRNVAYIGKVEDRKTGKVYEGRHEGIVPVELFEKTQKLLAARPSKGKGRRPKETFLLRGLLRCGACGDKMYPRERIYGCVNRRCPKRGAISRRQVDDEIWGYFSREGLGEDATLDAIVEARDAQLKAARTQREAAERQLMDKEALIAKRLSQFNEGRIEPEDYYPNRKELASERDALAAQIEQLQRREADVDAQYARIDASQEMQDRLEEIRRTIAGEIAKSQSAEAAAALLLRAFDQVVLHRPDEDGNLPAREIMREEEQERCELIRAARFVLVFRLRGDVFQGWDDDGKVVSRRHALPGVELKTNYNQPSGWL